jgi:hypothetical protein
MKKNDKRLPFFVARKKRRIEARLAEAIREVFGEFNTTISHGDADEFFAYSAWLIMNRDDMKCGFTESADG